MNSRVIFLDTETTGLSPNYARIVEIAAIEVDGNFSPVRAFHEYLDPKQRVGSSSAIHGLTDEFLQGRKTFRDIAPDFVDFVRGATVYAHNMPFDRRFLDAELARCGFESLGTFAEPIDTLRWARSKVGGSAKLDVLLELFDIDASARASRHGALIDAELLLQVFLCLGGNRSRALELNFEHINKTDALYQKKCSPSPIIDSQDDFDDGQDELPSVVATVKPSVLYSYGEYKEKLEAIVDFASNHPFFEGDMYEDILEKYLETGYLSPAQEQAIDNVCEGFRIW